jgi:hypothetical protein
MIMLLIPQLDGLVILLCAHSQMDGSLNHRDASTVEFCSVPRLATPNSIGHMDSSTVMMLTKKCGIPFHFHLPFEEHH